MSSAGHGATRGQAWFCTTGLPSDVVFDVQDMSFHLHKFPLMSKSRKIHRMVMEQEEEQPPRRRRRRRRRRRTTSEGSNAGEEGAEQTEIEEAEEVEEEDEEEEQARKEEGRPYCIVFPDFPGGPGTFEAAAKFCYGVRVELTAWNVVPLRCAAEYLEMTEEHAEDNLAARAEAYLEQTVLRHPGEATKALKSCEELLPHAEELGIVDRCVEAIAARSSAASRSWFDDLAVLGLQMYKRVMAAMAERADVRTEARESCLVSYAKGTIPGLSRSMRRRLASAPVSSEVEQRELLEAVVASLPADKCSGRVVTAKFLFALLRTAHILRASNAARAALERKAATQLEHATLEDVLIPSYSGATETLYDVDCVERVVRHFLAEEEELGEAEASTSAAAITEEAAAAATTLSRPSAVAMVHVGKLVDSYLAEVASDDNLKPAKFCELALALPDHARIYDDGVYRAVDIYLKAHPRLTAEERDRVCGVVDGRKLTVEACTHAAQNERLPLRAVLQVLFFEQLQLRRAITGTLMSSSSGAPQARQHRHYHQQPRPAAPSSSRHSVDGTGGDAWRPAAMQESQVLRLDMDSMRNRVQDLERECSSMRRAIKKIDGRGSSCSAAGSPRRSDAGDASADGSARPANWRSRYGCKFSTQVCDSHARNVVASRASRMGMSP
ncbi:BTB/POZ domain-containing protein At5g66560-like [Oryza brachyantha]|uniref:BTB/POZ domain-containing protein At5g66560-like n=1 Tax=Oryza brachyantha TaxID=4533 RepID=UPI001ADB4925|nr:BTB/POZ domain-containing protein At5g66560-like [Oryza brachyantha]